MAAALWPRRPRAIAMKSQIVTRQRVRAQACASVNEQQRTATMTSARLLVAMAIVAYTASAIKHKLETQQEEGGSAREREPRTTLLDRSICHRSDWQEQARLLPDLGRLRRPGPALLAASAHCLLPPAPPRIDVHSREGPLHKSPLWICPRRTVPQRHRRDESPRVLPKRNFVGTDLATPRERRRCALLRALRRRVVFRRRPRDRRHAIHELRPEDDVRVVEHALLERDDDELRRLEVGAEHHADVLRVRQVEGGIDLVQNIHRAPA